VALSVASIISFNFPFGFAVGQKQLSNPTDKEWNRLKSFKRIYLTYNKLKKIQKTRRVACSHGWSWYGYRTVACSVDLPIYAVYTDYSHSLAHGFTKLTKSESSRSRNVTEAFSTSTPLIFGPRYTKANWLDSLPHNAGQPVHFKCSFPAEDQPMDVRFSVGFF